jgi:hypothetical protein
MSSGETIGKTTESELRLLLPRLLSQGLVLIDSTALRVAVSGPYPGGYHLNKCFVAATPRHNRR